MRNINKQLQPTSKGMSVQNSMAVVFNFELKVLRFIKNCKNLHRDIS